MQMDKIGVVTSFIHNIIVYNIPLLYGTVGEIVVEKSGSLNLGVEGIMAVGAIFGYVCGCYANSLGAGIAVAFVATIYGLVVANLFTIPYSTRAKRKYAHIFTSMELMIEGILSIQAGESPALIERKLECYIVDKKPSKGNKA